MKNHLLYPLFHPVTTAVTHPYDNIENYITIDIGSIFNDLKVKYFSSKLEDHLHEIDNSYLSQIFNYYDELTLKEEIFSNIQSIMMEKNDGFFDGYDNIRDADKKHISYLFDLNIEKNKTIMSKLSFLNLEMVKENLALYKETYIFIYGTRVYDKSYYKILQIDSNSTFLMVYKDQNDRFYQFEQIKINLTSYYEFQKNYLVFLINQEIKENNLNNLIEFIDKSESYVALSPDQEINR